MNLEALDARMCLHLLQDAYKKGLEKKKKKSKSTGQPFETILQDECAQCVEALRTNYDPQFRLLQRIKLHTTHAVLKDQTKKSKAQA